MITTKMVIQDLFEHSDERYRANVIKLGIPAASSIGVSTSFIRKYARTIPRNNDFALALWHEGYHEARLLAVLLFEPNRIDRVTLDDLVTDIVSWDLCDHFVKELVIKTGFFKECIAQWVKSDALFTRRASFVTMCTHVLRDEAISDEIISYYLQSCIDNADSSEVVIKKALSWTMREIGKMDVNRQEQVLLACYDLMESQSKAKQWLAKDVIKEVENLVKVADRRRLINKSSKMGRQS